MRYNVNMKFTLYPILVLCVVSCSAIPQQAEIEYRNTLENTLLETFPQKMSIVIHPFLDRTPKNTNDAYLSDAIPDTIESMLEPMRASLAHIPFDSMPFYVSEDISNLFQQVDSTNTNTNTTDTASSNTNSYFSYLTNYLTPIPVQVTQIEYDLTTNTNYYEVTTNTTFQLGEEITNFVSNEILKTTTNDVQTNLVEEFRNVLSTTNMLLLIAEEFPELINYLSFIPIEIRRATEEDISAYEEYLEWQKNPSAWNQKIAQEQNKEIQEAVKKKTEELQKQITENPTNQINMEEEIKKVKSDLIEANLKKNEFPTDPFEFSYHITGNYLTKQLNKISPLNTDIRIRISAVQSTGLRWWLQNKKQAPPKLSGIQKLVALLDVDNPDLFKDKGLRTPYTKNDISPRLQDAFDTISTNVRETRPMPPDDMPLSKDISIRIRAREDEIPIQIINNRKAFFATIINRPHTVLNVQSNPDDTLVYLNGFYIGTTPLSYATAPIGEQRVSFIKEGFKREEVLVDVKEGITNSLVFKLARENTSGEIFVTASVPDAEVFVNSKFQGKTPLIISNLSLGEKYRVEILNPQGDISSNRNSVYKKFVLTQEKPRVDFEAKFKDYETQYRPPSQKALLVGTYISWIATAAVMGGSIYTQAISHENRTLSTTAGLSADQRNAYINTANQNAIASQVLLYSSLAGIIVSSGIMGWYLYSKDIYLGLDYDPMDQEWYANFKLKF